jgi:hypothetical protein
LQRIDVVKINAFHLVYSGIDIAWDGDIDDKKSGRSRRACSIGPRFPGRSKAAVGRCRCNQDVDFATLGRPLIEGNDATTDHPRKFVRAIDRTIAHAKIIHTARNQGPAVRSLVSPRPQAQDFAIAELPENSLRKIDSDRSNRNQTARDVSVGAHLFRHPKGALKTDDANMGPAVPEERAAS